MLKWIRILILIISGGLLALRLFWPPVYVKAGNLKTQYTPYQFVSYREYLKERTEKWQKFLREKSYLERPLGARVNVAINYYNSNIMQDVNVKSQPKEIKDKLYDYVINSARVIDLNTFRDVVPEYNDLSDNEIKNKMYEKFYKKDMTFEEFSKMFTKNYLSLGPEEHKLQIKVTGPHFNLVPSINFEILVAQCIGIIAIGVFVYWVTLILEKKN